MAGSTLVVAALFGPVRRRVQAVVDRRFNRARYDATRAVTAFGQRLRDEVDLDEVATGLRDTAARTIEPVSVSLWLAASAEPVTARLPLGDASAGASRRVSGNASGTRAGFDGG